jgi:DNA-binding GntR family transcriptional regulator
MPLTRLQLAPELTDQVHARLHEAIVNGDLPPGARITQDSLAEQFAVSRQPVLQALKLLKREGLVVDAPGRGLLVAPLDALQIEQLYQVRGALDALAAALAAAQRVALAPNLLERGRKAAQSGRVSQLIEADLAFHQAIYMGCGNPLIAESAGQHWHHIRRVMGAVLREADARAAIWDEHEAIARAIARGDEAHAARLAQTHCEVAGRNLAAKLSSVTHAAAQR